MKRLLPLVIASTASLSFAADLPKPIASFLEEHCTKCHDSETKKGDLDLTSLSYDLGSPTSLQRWEDVFDRVAEGEMPPKKKTQPRPEDRQRFLLSLASELKSSATALQASIGRVQARHLTRSEYERSVQDLLGAYIPLQSGLAEDPLTDGFNTVAMGQQISPNQIESFLSVTENALSTAFTQALGPVNTWKKTCQWQELAHGTGPNDRGPEGRPSKQDVVAWNGSIQFYGRMPATKVPADGWYRIKITAKAVNPPKGGRICAGVYSGVHMAHDPIQTWVGSIEATEQEAEYTFAAWMLKGHLLLAVPTDHTLPPLTGHKQKGVDNYQPLDGLAFPGIAIRTIEMERIYPGFSPEDTRKVLFGDLEVQPITSNDGTRKEGGKKVKTAEGKTGEAMAFSVVPKDSASDLKILVQNFASRAFRRPIAADDIQEYLQFANTKLAEGEPFWAAVQSAYKAILTSPRFFYFAETPGVLDDHALATRLSYFLWGSTPDNELRTLADAGKLRNPATLRQQVDRLLNSGNVARFVRNFTDQWLKLSEIDATDPDHKLYREFDEALKYAMLDETRAYFRDLIDRDLSAKNIVTSDYTFVNSRLAKHYGLPCPPQAGLQRVALTPDQHRGGIITQGSVLKVTANGTTTSPILRGVWLMERILGQPAPPPPPNVPAIEPDIRGAKGIREQLDKHRTQEACAVCHVKIDPPGFALENYDVIGGWRQKYRAVDEKGHAKEGLPVNPSYQLADGSRFTDISEFKKLLLKNPDQLARNLTRQLVTYGTGASPTFADRERIEAILIASKPRNYGVRTLIYEIIQSPLFLNK